jgi:hypothetical protein
LHVGSPAGHLEPSERSEQLLGPALQRLRPYGFEVLHDVSWPGRRRTAIDYVLVGPSGVFVMHTESWSGTVTVEAESLRQNGYSRVQQTEAVRRSALVVGLSLGASWAALVVPVICLVGGAELVPTRAGPVTVLSLDHLTAWLLSQPSPLTSAGVNQVVKSLRVALPGDTAVVIPDQAPARIRLPKSQRRASVELERRAVPRNAP